jgi:hypothetical protein
MGERNVEERPGCAGVCDGAAVLTVGGEGAGAGAGDASSSAVVVVRAGMGAGVTPDEGGEADDVEGFVAVAADALRTAASAASAEEVADC